MQKILLLLLCLWLSGCTSVQQIRPEDIVSPPKLNPEGSVYITIPADGQYGAKTYSGSGQTTAQILLSAFSKHLNRVEISVGIEQFEVGIERAKSKGFTYLVYPTILHWEDRATEWSGISDKVEIKIIIVDADSSNTIDSIIIKGKSKWFTFGGDHPQDLLPESINDYVSSLF